MTSRETPATRETPGEDPLIALARGLMFNDQRFNEKPASPPFARDIHTLFASGVLYRRLVESAYDALMLAGVGAETTRSDMADLLQRFRASNAEGRIAIAERLVLTQHEVSHGLGSSTHPSPFRAPLAHEYKALRARDRELTALLRHVRGSPVVVVAGGPQVGVTSMLRAGLYATLARRPSLGFIPYWIEGRDEGEIEADLTRLEHAWSAGHLCWSKVFPAMRSIVLFADDADVDAPWLTPVLERALCPSRPRGPAYKAVLGVRCSAGEDELARLRGALGDSIAVLHLDPPSATMLDEIFSAPADGSHDSTVLAAQLAAEDDGLVPSPSHAQALAWLLRLGHPVQEITSAAEALRRALETSVGEITRVVSAATLRRGGLPDSEQDIEARTNAACQQILQALLDERAAPTAEAFERRLTGAALDLGHDAIAHIISELRERGIVVENAAGAALSRPALPAVVSYLSGRSAEDEVVERVEEAFRSKLRGAKVVDLAEQVLGYLDEMPFDPEISRRLSSWGRQHRTELGEFVDEQLRAHRRRRDAIKEEKRKLGASIVRSITASPVLDPLDITGNPILAVKALVSRAHHLTDEIRDADARHTKFTDQLTAARDDLRRRLARVEAEAETERLQLAQELAETRDKVREAERRLAIVEMERERLANRWASEQVQSRTPRAQLASHEGDRSARDLRPAVMSATAPTSQRDAPGLVAESTHSRRSRRGGAAVAGGLAVGALAIAAVIAPNRLWPPVAIDQVRKAAIVMNSARDQARPHLSSPWPALRPVSPWPIGPPTVVHFVMCEYDKSEDVAPLAAGVAGLCKLDPAAYEVLFVGLADGQTCPAKPGDGPRPPDPVVALNRARFVSGAVRARLIGADIEADGDGVRCKANGTKLRFVTTEAGHERLPRSWAPSRRRSVQACAYVRGRTYSDPKALTTQCLQSMTEARPTRP